MEGVRVKRQHIKAVAFDAYGTLVEIGEKRRPFARLASMAGRDIPTSPLTEQMDLEQFYAAVGLHPDNPPLESLQSDLTVELASTHAYPEAAFVLGRLHNHGIRTAVASNLAKPYAGPIRNELGEFFDALCFSFEVGAVKPDVAFYTALAEMLQLQPSEILMVGDTWRCDYEGAINAGFAALHLDRRKNAAPHQVAVSIHDLRGVLGALDIDT